MEKKDISDLLPAVDGGWRAKYGSKLEKSIGYYESEMDRLRSTLSYEEREKIPEYEARYVQERRAEEHTQLDALRHDQSRITFYLGIWVAIFAMIIVIFNTSWLGYTSRELRDMFTQAFSILTIVVFFGLSLWRIISTKRHRNYSKMKGDEKLTLYAQYAFQTEAMKTLLEGGREASI